MTDFDTFRLSCCRLLEQYPLCRYRYTADGEQTLNILLAGNGTRMETLIQMFLTNGQLLDTRLHVTVLHAGTATAQNFLAISPALQDFVQITRDGKLLSDPEDPLVRLRLERCAMTPEALGAKLAAFGDAAYVVVSTGNDEKNRNLARVCAQTLPREQKVVACVQKSLNHGFGILAPEPTQIIGGIQNEEYLCQLREIAYNLHYIYAKTSNDRLTPAQIRRDFEKPYNYLSNLESALHIQSKLHCCGIDTHDSAGSAAAFAAVMQRDSSIVSRLAVVEHRRWVMEKLLQGYRPQTDFSQIYSRRGVTTKNTEEKWHTCLVQCRTGSTIAPEAWDSGPIPPELDPLDQVSIRIHRKCGELARANRGLIHGQLDAILSTLHDWPGASAEVLEDAEALVLLVSQLYQQNRNSIGKFLKRVDSLRRQIQTASAPHVPLLMGQLDVLEFAVSPLIEYISYKNYKEQDELMVRHIPFTLTHRSQSTILKLMANREMDCLLSTWQLEPKHVIYTAWAETQFELDRLLNMASHIRGALMQGSLEIDQEYHVFLSNDLMDKYDDLPLENCSVYRLGSGGPGAMMEVFADVAQDLRADYIDVTGADPAMILAAQKYAMQSGTPMIYAKNGRFQSLQGAEEIHYPGPGRHMTVREMFSLSGAVVTQNDSDTLTDLSKKYRDFWNIVKKNPIWTLFAKECTIAYNRSGKMECVLPKPDLNASLKRKYIAIPTDAKKLLLSVMRKLQAHSLLNLEQVNHEFDGVWRIEFSTYGPALAERLVKELYRIAQNMQPDMFCQVRPRENGICITVSPLTLQGLTPPPENIDDYTKLIQALAGKKILLNTEYSDDTGSWSFRFGSRDILNAFQSSGKVLEYYLYYSALLHGKFDDVQMGWSFNHSNQDDSANNELDVVCTRGASSLFISAKHVGLSRFDSDGYLNHVCYEVSLLADRFGVNAIPVLAAPTVPMFEGDAPSKFMKQATRRGVCLLGRECFESDRIAQCLNNMIKRKKDWWL